MFHKFFVFMFGKKVSTTIAGIAAGAVTGVAVTAANGGLTKEQLVAGAASGALSALAGASGRAHGEK